MKKTTRKYSREESTYRHLYQSKKFARTHRRAKSKGEYHVFTLTYKEFTDIILKPCHYCGTPPSMIHTYSNGDPVKYNGLDRIDSFKEYTIDNVVSCCKYCNWAKNVMTVEEFKEHIKKMYFHFASR